MELAQADPLTVEDPLELLTRTIERWFDVGPDFAEAYVEWRVQVSDRPKAPTIAKRAAAFILTAKSRPGRDVPASKPELCMALARLFGETVKPSNDGKRKMFWRRRPEYREEHDFETDELRNAVSLRIAVEDFHPQRTDGAVAEVLV